MNGAALRYYYYGYHYYSYYRYCRDLSSVPLPLAGVTRNCCTIGPTLKYCRTIWFDWPNMEHIKPANMVAEYRT